MQIKSNLLTTVKGKTGEGVKPEYYLPSKTNFRIWVQERTMVNI